MTGLLGERTLPNWPDRPEPGALEGIVDVHAHPTDYKQFGNEKSEYRDETGKLSLDQLCAMSSHLGDQHKVEQLVQEHPDKITPAFGLHPWWSHHISFEDELPDKLAHYRRVFPGQFDEPLSPEAQALLDSFPDPTLYSTFVSSTLRPLLEAHPHAMLGEVGLDRSFRIPLPREDPKSNRAEGEKLRKKLTNIYTPIEHQLSLLKKQLDLAFELNRNISMHSVQVVGATVELFEALSKDPRWTKSTSKIDLHSYGGSADTIARMLRIHKDRLYFSFSTTINARLPRLEDLIRAVPDDRLLIESDFNDVRSSEIRIWEILGIVCDAKQWDKEHATKQLRDNWLRFSSRDS